jgi:hypothetical protein
MIALLSLLTLMVRTANAENSIDVSATAESVAFAGIADDSGDNGFTSELTLILESDRTDALSFRAEGGYLLTYGSASPLSSAFDAGIAVPPDPAALGPGMDLHRTFFLNQAYAQASLDRIRFQAGIIPVSWGSAYLWNPTSRTAALTFPGENIDETAGKPGGDITFAIPLPESSPISLMLEGYALATGRLSSPIPDIDELEADNVPFGLKLQARMNVLDISFSVIRELVSATSAPALSFGADIAFSVGDLNCYAEAITEYDRHLAEASELSTGFSWMIPIIEVTARSEYIRLGRGESNPDNYDAFAFLEGSKILLARDYLYAGLDKEDPDSARWKVSGGVLINLDDGSLATLAELTILPMPEFELSWFLRAFIASSGDDAEFGGKRALGPDVYITPYGSATGLSAKWTF